MVVAVPSVVNWLVAPCRIVESYRSWALKSYSVAAVRAEINIEYGEPGSVCQGV